MKQLIKIQAELKAPKNQYNGFGKYKYRSCEDILEAVKPLLTKNKVSLIVKDEIVIVGERYYVKATAELYDEDSNLIATNSAYAREPENKKGMDESQITGATSSYARKYALNGLLAIDDTKDADSTNTHDKPNPAPVKASKLLELKRKMYKEFSCQTAEAVNTKLEELTGKKQDIAKMTEAQAQKVLEEMDKPKAKPVPKKTVKKTSKTSSEVQEMAEEIFNK